MYHLTMWGPRGDIFIPFTSIGGFELLDLIIAELKSRMTYQKFKVSHWWKFYLSKKNPLQDLLSSLNAVISTNERH